MESTPIRLGQRPALDGLRGIAVLLVVGVHLSLVSQGYVGVDVFLVLSGFLITVLLLEEHERTGRISLRRFGRRRARRLLPALAVLLAVFTALVLTIDPYGSTWPLGRLVATTSTFANNWVATLVPEHGRALGALSPTWTLAQEVQFYLLWSVGLAFATRLGMRPAALAAALGLAIAALLLGGAYLRHASTVYNSYTSPLDRSAELLLGAAAAVTWRHGWMPGRLRSSLGAWLAAAGLGFIVLDRGLGEHSSYLAAAGLSAWLIVSLLSTEDVRHSRPSPSPGRRPALSGALSRGPLRYLGRVSYGIYLYHLPVYYLIWHYAPGHSHMFYAPLVLGLTVALAGASWRVIEAPASRGRPRGRAPEAPPRPQSVVGTRAQRQIAVGRDPATGHSNPSTIPSRGDRHVTAAQHSRRYHRRSRRRRPALR